ncbi:MAG: carboxylate-amine ligase [Rhodospirillaceae bacterium]|nr:carboxylate-amine ligase [Rhodospirillaceae bacterium]
MPRPSFTMGIEEEYLLVDRDTRDLIQTSPDALLGELEGELGSQISTEFLQSQVEVGTKVCSTAGEARADLARLRRGVSQAAERHGFGMIAASTHPFARWGEQRRTENLRYQQLADDLQGVIRRLVICGMHIHICIEDPDLRIDLMNQISYFLPHILALSTSSPFWEGRDTGLASYRLSVFDTLPRTGLPTVFDNWSEYERHVNILVQTGVIEDATKIWWDIRPSARYPTLEMRICDVATSIDDAIAIAALLQSLLHMLYRLRLGNQRWRQYSGMLIQENRWRAQRYGIDEGLIDFGKREMHPYAALLEEMVELVREDAEELGCTTELAHVHTILERGTSAHRQRRVLGAAIETGKSREEALKAVVDDLIEASGANLSP